ncbi:MAG: DUF2721 domain-containing protein [Cyanobacteria bacterium RI_101]|nr:DUF2721 domain-containing protein [Cyanobacteria bacterium RI_101]
MNAEVVVETIQLVIAPTVMISSCTLIQNAILGRYSAISDRLRFLVRERLDLLEKYNISEPVYAEALQIIDRQLVMLSRRYLLIQNVVLLLYSAIAFFLLTMFAIALAKELRAAAFSYMAFVLFLAGTGALVIGVFWAAAEVRISHQAVRSEVRWAISLTNEK